MSRLERSYLPLALVVLAVAAFNLGYRLDRESVGEWDESLYATSAWEMLRSGDLVGTTFDGRLDYSNSKPPLQVWVLAASFQLGGLSLLSLRLASATFGWLTVLVLVWWGPRVVGRSVALLAGLVLASSFGFLHLHSGRSGNPDALLTLLVLLVVVTLWSARERPNRFVWTGPLLAAVFLLKGAAVLMPLTIVVLFEGLTVRTSVRERLRPYLSAAAAFTLPVGLWVVARWRVDQWRFFERLVNQDLLTLSLVATDGRGGGPFYYLDVLQKHHFDWLGVAALAAFVLRGQWRAGLAAAWHRVRAGHHLGLLVCAWATATVAVPSAMQTKLFWYLNPFYPLFALGVGWLVVAAIAHGQATGRRGAAALVGVVTVAGFVVAEARGLWHLLVVTNLDASVQGLLLSDPRYARRRVHRDRMQRAEAFVVKAMRDGEFHAPAGTESSHPLKPGDVLILSVERKEPSLRLVAEVDGSYVYEATSDLIVLQSSLIPDAR